MENERTYCVYKHTTPSGKVYIGQTKQEPEKRWQNGNGYKNNEHFWKAIKKYGWDNIKHEILKINLTKPEADDIEKTYIALYQSNISNFGYNKTDGGDGHLGYSPTEETRKKISSTLTGHEVSDETRQKLSIAQKGKPKNYTEEYLQRLREERIGKPLSEKHMSAISKSVLCIETGIIYKSCREAGRMTGIDYNAICNVCNHKYGFKTAGGYNWCYVNNYNAEEYVKNTVSNRPKEVICIETKEVYISLLDAQKNTGISASAISNCCKGKYGFKTAGGYHWCFLEEYNEEEWTIEMQKIANKSDVVICIETGCVYESPHDAKMKTDINSSHIKEVCVGGKGRKTAGGYHWMFYDEYLKQKSEDNYECAI